MAIILSNGTKLTSKKNSSGQKSWSINGGAYQSTKQTDSILSRQPTTPAKPTALLPSSQNNSTALGTSGYKVQSGGDEDISGWLKEAKQFENDPAPVPTFSTPSWQQQAASPFSTNSFTTGTIPKTGSSLLPSGYISTNVKPSDIDANQGARPHDPFTPANLAANVAISAANAIPVIGPLLGGAGAALSGYGQTQTQNPVAVGVPNQPSNSVELIRGQASSPTIGSHMGGADGGVNASTGGVSTGTVGGNVQTMPTPNRANQSPLQAQPSGINVSTPSIPALPTVPTGPTSTGGGGGALIPQAPAFNNPYATLKNEYGDPYRGALLGRMNDEAARQNAAMRDTIRNQYADQGMGGSGFEKLADFKNDLQMRGQMSQNFNSSLTDMADKSMAFELQKAGGLLAGQGQQFNQHVQGAKLAPEVEALVLGNDNTRTQLQFLRDNYQTMLQKEKLGLQLTQEEIAQMKFIRENAPLLAALNAVGAALPGAMRLMGGK